MKRAGASSAQDCKNLVFFLLFLGLFTESKDINPSLKSESIYIYIVHHRLESQIPENMKYQLTKNLYPPVFF